MQGPAELTISPLSKESSAEQTRHITARLVIGADGAMSPGTKAGRHLLVGLELRPRGIGLYSAD